MAENRTSIFADKKKPPKPKTKESNNLNYYKNFLVNTENFFSKADPSNGSKSQRTFKLKEFATLEHTNPSYAELLLQE